MKRLVLIFLAALTVSASAEPVSAVHFARGFHFPGQSERFTLHVVKPTPDGEAGSTDAHGWLEKLASFVWRDARDNGYLNELTTLRYVRELRKLREGRWPSVFITREGSSDILVNLSFAIRWGNERLPYQDSFYDMGIANQPREISPEQRLSIGYRDVYWLKYLSLDSAQNYIYLINHLANRPVIEGEEAEIKFLVGSERNPIRFLQVIHQASVDYELARFSRIKPTEKKWEEYRRYVREHGSVRSDYPYFKNPSGGDDRVERAISDYMHSHFYDEAWTPHVLNSRLYLHASDWPGDRDPEKTLRYRFFVEKLGFPARPFWAFEETAETGTAGIWTNILSASAYDYERIVGTNLTQFRSGIDGSNAAIFDPPTLCRGIFSRIEAAIDDFLLAP